MGKPALLHSPTDTLTQLYDHASLLYGTICMPPGTNTSTIQFLLGAPATLRHIVPGITQRGTAVMDIPAWTATCV